MSEYHTTKIEVLYIDYDLFEGCGIEVVSNELSINDWRDVSIRGTKKSLMYYLQEYYGEGALYFKNNQID